MKKRFAMTFSLVCAFSLLGTLSCFAQSNSSEMYSSIVSNLEKDNYGGAYIKDGVLHIKPMKEADENRFLKTITRSNSNSDVEIIFDDVAKYSMVELTNAMEDAIPLFEDLDIDFVAIDEQNNGLVVGVYNVTEEKKAIFCDTINIENIVFEELNTWEVVNENIDSTDSPSTTSIKAAKPVSSGVEATDSNVQIDGNHLSSTIGASAGSSNKKYFVTTAHGTNKGDSFRYSSLGEIGTVAEKVMSGAKGIDISLIEVNEDNATLTMGTIDNHIILASGAPVSGSNVKIINGNTPATAKITYASCTKIWNEEKYNDFNTYKNIMMMELTGSTTTGNGDSGSAVVTEFTSAGNTYYNICGIYKGRSEDAGKETRATMKYLYATRWDVLSDYFDISIY